MADFISEACSTWQDRHLIYAGNRMRERFPHEIRPHTRAVENVEAVVVITVKAIAAAVRWAVPTTRGYG